MMSCIGWLYHRCHGRLHGRLVVCGCLVASDRVAVVLIASTPKFLAGHGDVGGFDCVAVTSLICELVAHALENRHGAGAQVGAALSGVS
jgi:hypothetical protein